MSVTAEQYFLGCKMIHYLDYRNCVKERDAADVEDVNIVQEN